MTYYTVEIDSEIFSVKRLSLAIPLFKVSHKRGFIEIYNNPVTGKWSTLFRSNPNVKISAEIIGPKIWQFYHSAYFLNFVDAQEVAEY